MKIKLQLTNQVDIEIMHLFVAYDVRLAPKFVCLNLLEAEKGYPNYFGRTNGKEKVGNSRASVNVTRKSLGTLTYNNNVHKKIQ